MRRPTIWLRLFALFALIPIVASVSAQAALCLMPRTSGKCCMIAAKPESSETHDCCAKEKDSITSIAGPTISPDESCKCYLKSAAKARFDEKIATQNVRPASVESDQAQLNPLEAPAFEPLAKNAPSVFFGDSSPPTGGHANAAHGRAPPTPVR